MEEQGPRILGEHTQVDKMISGTKEKNKLYVRWITIQQAKGMPYSYTY